MKILPNKNTIIVDTKNDRIIELDSAGKITKGIQGNNRLSKIDRDFVVLTALYNPNLNKLWITFSQYITLSDDIKTKISITNKENTISFGSVDPNNSKNIINVIPLNSSNNKSTTIEVTFPDIFANQIYDWISAEQIIQIIIDPSAVICAGSDTEESPTGTSGTSGYSGLPYYFEEPTRKYLYMGKNEYLGYSGFNTLGTLTRYSGTDGYIGLPAIEDEIIINEGDFDGDGIISNSTTDILLSPDLNTGKIQINVIIENIIFDNIFEPLYIQVKDTGWLVTTVKENTAIFYDNNLVKIWYIPSNIVALRENIDANAYLLSNNYVAFATPAPEITTGATNGEIIIIDKNSGTPANPQYSIITRIPINNGDAVRVIPNDDETEFWVVVNDRIGKGINSRIIRIDYLGNIKWSWNGSSDDKKLYSPTDLKILPNNTLLVSE
jgi:hypothetical protein